MLLRCLPSPQRSCSSQRRNASYLWKITIQQREERRLTIRRLVSFFRSHTHRQQAGSSVDLIGPGRKPDHRDAFANQCHHETYTHTHTGPHTVILCVCGRVGKLFVLLEVLQPGVIRVVRQADLQTGERGLGRKQAHCQNECVCVCVCEREKVCVCTVKTQWETQKKFAWFEDGGHDLPKISQVPTFIWAPVTVWKMPVGIKLSTPVCDQDV